jgi:hypothetical protein
MVARCSEKIIGCLLLVGATLLGAIGSARSETIQKWRAPDGTLYFGDTPPAGSKKIGEEGSSEPPAGGSSQESAPPSAEKERLSIDASRERTQIEQALNSGAARLEELDAQIAEAQSAPNVVPGWMERRAGIKNEKAQTLRELRSQRHATLATMADLWKRFDKLDASVRQAYQGEAPIWWRSKLSCAKCPSRSEAEDAQRNGPED